MSFVGRLSSFSEVRNELLLWERSPEVCPLLGGCLLYRRVSSTATHCYLRVGVHESVLQDHPQAAPVLTADQVTWGELQQVTHGLYPNLTHTHTHTTHTHTHTHTNTHNTHTHHTHTKLTLSHVYNLYSGHRAVEPLYSGYHGRTLTYTPPRRPQ